MQHASDFKFIFRSLCSRLVAVFPTAVCMRKRTSHSCPENSLEPLSKGSDKYGPFDQIAAEMYVIRTLLGRSYR